MEAAASEFDRATDLQPQDLWAQFSRGICAYRRRCFDTALSAFDVCVALSPGTAECYYNRGRAHAALGHTDLALRDYNHALRLAPTMALASLNRGILYYREKRYSEAIDDFRRALEGVQAPRRSTTTWPSSISLAGIARPLRPISAAPSSTNRPMLEPATSSTISTGILPYRRTGPMRGEDNTSHAGNPAARGRAEVHHPLLTAVELEKTRASPFRAVVAG